MRDGRINELELCNECDMIQSQQTKTEPEVLNTSTDSRHGGEEQ
jgi:hypothetical protein